MKENVSRGGPIVKKKRAVWEIKAGVYSPNLINRSRMKTETKTWDIKIILN
jgi:hypothetical protein